MTAPTAEDTCEGACFKKGQFDKVCRHHPSYVDVDVVHIMTAEGCKISVNGQGHLPCSEHAYAKCKDCELELANRPLAEAHMRETFEATGKTKGHAIVIVNPTPEEQIASRARAAIGDALDKACEELYEEVERGRLTLEQIKAELWIFDFADIWEAYVAEDEEED